VDLHTSRVGPRDVGQAVVMAREIPEVVRAAAGLAATVLDEARKLPETLPGLPVRLIGLAMQQAMKAQQTYAGFVARGDELFTGLRGEDEPGLATFDDEVEPVTAPTGFRDSAFDRAGETEPTSASADLIVDDEVAELPADPAADAVTAVVDELAEQVEDGRQSIEELVQEAPDTEAILDEIAIDELVDQAPTLEETAPAEAAKATEPAKPAKAAKPVKSTKPRKTAKSPAKGAAATEPAEDAAAQEMALLEATLAAPGSADSVTAADTVDAEPTADVATTVDVLTPAGEVETVEAAVTDEGVAAPEAAAEDGPAADAPAGGDTGSSAPISPPIDGYDSFSVAQLRGRLRGYALSTVQDLIAYEEATRSRAPYLTLLRNRLEKLEEQAVESSPLAPRGA
jgi:hypothetical protein